MSSRGGGPRSAGTDGSDHAFRQTVDTKYKKAAVARRNLIKTLRMLFAYYPLAGAFAVGPALGLLAVRNHDHLGPDDFASLALYVGSCVASPKHWTHGGPAKLRSLSYLDLSGNKLGGAGGMAVAELLQANKSLRAVYLANCELTTESLVALATVLNPDHQPEHEPPALVALDVSRPLAKPSKPRRCTRSTHSSSRISITKPVVGTWCSRSPSVRCACQ